MKKIPFIIPFSYSLQGLLFQLPKWILQHPFDPNRLQFESYLLQYRYFPELLQLARFLLGDSVVSSAVFSSVVP